MHARDIFATVAFKKLTPQSLFLITWRKTPSNFAKIMHILQIGEYLNISLNFSML